MDPPTIPFRVTHERRFLRLQAFNRRNEIQWFGFEGAFNEPGTAIVTFKHLNDGLLGGGGIAAINGGVISAGFDAAFVLAGLGQYDVDVVVTLELSVQFLTLARVTESLAFHAEVVRSSKNFCFAKGGLSDTHDANPTYFATASAMLAPVK